MPFLLQSKTRTLSLIRLYKTCRQDNSQKHRSSEYITEHSVDSSDNHNGHIQDEQQDNYHWQHQLPDRSQYNRKLSRLPAILFLITILRILSSPSLYNKKESIAVIGILCNFLVAVILYISITNNRTLVYYNYPLLLLPVMYTIRIYLKDLRLIIFSCFEKISVLSQ